MTALLAIALAVTPPLAPIVDRHARAGFSGAVVVDVGGRVQLARGVGRADRTRRLPNTAATVFDVGSFAKDYTGAAVMRLVEQGRLSLDDRLGTLLPGVPADKARITVRQLLGHRSGLRKVHFRYDFEPMTREEAVERILARPLLFTPGSSELYSDSGYTLLAAIVERSSGSSFVEFVRAQVFARAGLRTAGFYGHAWTGRVAIGYGPWQEGPVNSPAVWRGPSWALMGAGGVAMNAYDLIRFQRALRAGRVLKRASARALELAMFGAATPPPVVALGGANAYGFGATLIEFPRKDAYVAVLSNASRPREPQAERLADELARALRRRI